MSTQFATEPIEAAAASAESWTARLRQVEALLERRSAVPAFVRARPVASLAIAFGAGVMLATGRRAPTGWIARTAYCRLGKLVTAGVSAVAIAEARAWLSRTSSPTEPAGDA